MGISRREASVRGVWVQREMEQHATQFLLPMNRCERLPSRLHALSTSDAYELQSRMETDLGISGMDSNLGVSNL
jgi:hypothetical protein